VQKRLAKAGRKRAKKKGQWGPRGKLETYHVRRTENSAGDVHSLWGGGECEQKGNASIVPPTEKLQGDSGWVKAEKIELEIKGAKESCKRV